MKRHKRIALVAHDNRKQDLIEWVEWNWNAHAPDVDYNPLLVDYSAYIKRKRDLRE